MNKNSKRTNALIKLGLHLEGFDAQSPKYTALQECVSRAKINNGWFTQTHIETVFISWAKILKEIHLKKWLVAYHFKNITQPKTIALILAGNIPMVGFHDLICVWISGHDALIKCASKDEALLPYMAQFLEKEAGENAFTFTDQPFSNFDAVIATGSNNSARYFEHYFSNYPHIIRKNRNGIAVLDGKEKKEELEGLGKDILLYFGLGCRNVAKVYLPKDYDLNAIFGGLYPFAQVIEHAKYANNYDYNKAVFLMSEHTFLENGFFMIKEDPAFSAPIACLHYEYYQNEMELKAHLNENKESIQCIVSNLDIEGALCFGSAQQPALWDYADGVDTIAFLSGLS